MGTQDKKAVTTKSIKTILHDMNFRRGAKLGTLRVKSNLNPAIR